MKRLLAVAALFAFATSASALDWKALTGESSTESERAWKEADSPASPEELTALGVDAELAEMMRNRTAGPGTLLRGADRDAPIGIRWPVEATASVALVRQLRGELAKRGLVVFVAERSFGTASDHVGLVRAAEPVEVVVKRTVPPGISSEEWATRLRGWRKEAAWELLGVGEDWLEIEFADAPARPDYWVEEIARTAPAAVEGADARGALRDAIVRTRRALLWWKLPERPAR